MANETPAKTPEQVLHGPENAEDESFLSSIGRFLRRIGRRVARVLGWKLVDHLTREPANNNSVAKGKADVNLKAKPANANNVDLTQALPDRFIVKTIGSTKNKGHYVGLTKSLQEKLGVKAGDKVDVLVGGAPSIKYIVENIPADLLKEHPGNDLFVTRGDGEIGDNFNIARPEKVEKKAA